mgnify:FL=1
MLAVSSAAPAEESVIPAVEQVSKKEDIPMLLERGKRSLKAGEVELAEEDYLKVIAEQPDSVEANFYLGRVYLQTNEPGKAVYRLEKAVSLGAGKDPNAYYMLASALTLSGDFTKAIEAYLQAAKMSPHTMNIHHDMGLLYYRIGKIDKSIESLQTALKIDPASAKTMLALGSAYLRDNKPEHAMEYVMGLRGIKDEVKATHLENMIRAVQRSKEMPEPDAATLDPNIPQAAPQQKRAPGFPGRPQQTQSKVSITGNAQINLKGASEETEPEAETAY